VEQMENIQLIDIARQHAFPKKVLIVEHKSISNAPSQRIRSIYFQFTGRQQEYPLVPTYAFVLSV
jgi:hypothetical protein